MRAAATLTGAVAVCALSVAADAQSLRGLVSESMVAQCVHETRAPGVYEFRNGRGFPVVEPAAGGTRLGAHNVNDCLKDKLALQPDGTIHVYGDAGSAIVGEPVVIVVRHDHSGTYRKAHVAGSTLPRVGCRNGGTVMIGGSGYCTRY